MSDYSELIENLRAVASHLQQDPHGNPVAAAVNQSRAATVDKAADAIASLELNKSTLEEKVEAFDAERDFFIVELDRLLKIIEKNKKDAL
jgi:hypothetical protein